MAFSIQKLRSYICKEGDERMELLLFRLLCIAATAVSFLVIIPANYLHHLSPWISLVTAFFGLATLVLSRETCLGRYHLKTLFFIFLAVLNLVWFPNGGSHGSIGSYFFILYIYVPIFFRGKQRWLLGVAIASNALLLVSELYFPHWVIPYASSHHRAADLMVSLAVVALCCTLMLWVLLRRYDSEQQRLVGLNRDLISQVSERAEVERVLLQNRALLRSVIEGSTDAIFVKDVSGRYILFNHAAEKVTGKSAQEVLGNDDTFLFPPQEAQIIMQHDRQVLNSDETSRYRITVTDAAGKTSDREACKGPVHDAHGTVIGLFGISRDVTETRRMEEQLWNLNQELERRVFERTALLEAAMREQESFSYSVSHDLRGPLRHINSYAAILQEEFGTCLPPDALPYLVRVRDSSRRMGQLIDELLELSRIGRSELVKVTVDLSELARAVAVKLQEEEPARRADLVIEPGLQAKGDRVLLEQMLVNLIGNAWKYSSERACARIEIGKEVVEKREAFFVRDNGVGFDMAYRDKLFGPFQRLHGSEFEGTGIGLATVKRIVERHNGRVWAHGEVDRGATIYFTLP